VKQSGGGGSRNRTDASRTDSGKPRMKSSIVDYPRVQFTSLFFSRRNRWANFTIQFTTLFSKAKKPRVESQRFGSVLVQNFIFSTQGCCDVKRGTEGTEMSQLRPT